jgi:hypothetical protein
MGMRMGGVFRGNLGFPDGFMPGVGKRVIERVVVGIFEMPFPVHAGSCFLGEGLAGFQRLGRVSR